MADTKVDLTHFDTAKHAYDLSSFDKEDKPEDIGQLESLLRGAEQGVTFGFGDEINAGAEALVSSKSYEDALRESRQAMAAAEETNPKMYTTGEFMGAAGSLALPGIGAIGQASKGATLGARALGAAKAGAAAGAATKLGTSEDKMSMQTAKDMLEGAGEGGVAGAALAGIIPAAGKFIDTNASKLDYYNNLKRAYQAAKEGKSLVGKTEPLKSQIRGVARDDLTGGIIENQREIGSKLGQTRRTGDAVAVDELVPEMQSELSSMYAPGEAKQGVAKVKDIVKSLGENTGNSPEADAARTELQTLMGDVYGSSGMSGIVAPKPASRDVLDTTIKELQKIAYDETRTATERKAASSMADKLSKAAESSQPASLKPHTENLNTMFKGSLDAQAKLGISPESTGTSREARAAAESAVDNLTNMIEQFSDKASNSRQKIKEAIESLRVQGNTDPASGKKLQDLYALTKTVDPDALVNKIQSLSQDYKVAKQLTAQSSIDKSGNIIAGSVLQLSGKAIPLLGADAAGRVAAAPGQVGRKVIGYASDLTKASPEMLQTITDRLVKKGSPYAKQLERVLQQPDSLRKAMLFTLMQQSGFRSDIEDKGEQ